MLKKQKKSQEELAQERKDKINYTLRMLKLKLTELNQKQESLIPKIISAKKDGLSMQENQARQLLSKCLATQKNINGMIMTLELAVEMKDLEEITSSFMDIMVDISKDMNNLSPNKVSKKTENDFLRAKYNSEKNLQNLDKMIDNNDYSAALNSNNYKSTEYDEVIDTLIAKEENKSGTIDCSNINMKL